MSHAQAVPASPLKQWWLKWRFHLNILLILVPLGFMPKYFSDAKLFRGDAGLGANVVSGIQPALTRWTWLNCVTKRHAKTAPPATSSPSARPCAKPA